jgi:hypothetical protein
MWRFWGPDFYAIYEVDGDTLRLCEGVHAYGDPPRSFAAPAGSGTRLTVLKRVR